MPITSTECTASARQSRTRNRYQSPSHGPSCLSPYLPSRLPQSIMPVKKRYMHNMDSSSSTHHDPHRPRSADTSTHHDPHRPRSADTSIALYVYVHCSYTQCFTAPPGTTLTPDTDPPGTAIADHRKPNPRSDDMYACSATIAINCAVNVFSLFSDHRLAIVHTAVHV